MPDLLTHVLVGYILGTLFARRVSGKPAATTTVVMLGALLPDLTKIQIVVPSSRMEVLLGVPFAWHTLHTLGGVLLTAGIGALLVNPTNRRRVLGLLLAGATSHLVLDSFLLKPSGYASPMWWPFITTGLPTPGLYVSYDWWPTLVAGVLALIVFLRTSQRISEHQ
ncbi:metal-dependent hydrolase [Halobacterium bonnevillei]|uniref:Metal-dependent hydrolase n=1 Tax=Halobacterium bonnevillei TaxID=2692200 RepID=A0A6B0SCK4_9EURY|nr:metal-dependent hydrolase [Halobacterium bonnevillei]MXR19098.1 metal-dependent hydrolase [Halobacterium bonnevillei]